MVGQQLDEYVKNRFNLESRDIPKVMGLFVVAKYATLATGVAIGLRYEPLRRVVLARRLALGSSPWAQQRLRLLEVLKRAEKNQQARFWDAKKRLKHAGHSLFLRKQIVLQRQQHWLANQMRHSWYGWISQKYWHLADKLENAAIQNYYVLMLSWNLGLMPRKLAVGTAEGLLLAKLAVPLTAPLSLLLIVHAYGRPKVPTINSQDCISVARNCTQYEHPKVPATNSHE